MEPLLAALRAAAEPTRLRLLALAARGAFCVTELTEILGQSQPRLSRHLKLLCEAGLLDRVREGANVWFALPTGPDAGLARELVARLPTDDPTLEADRRQAARVLAERARAASERFRRQGADWDEMRALDLPAADVEAALLALVPDTPGARLLDIGTGTGRVLELLAPRVAQGLGVDASKAMLALARARLARTGLTHCAVRLADMYRLPLADAAFDIAVLQMVLHYAEDPAGVLAETARVLRPNGRLVVIDLAAHGRADVITRLAHRWPGFADDTMTALLAEAGLAGGAPVAVPGPLDMRIWPATRRADAAVAQPRELALSLRVPQRPVVAGPP
jgi:ArsR family transcriptional regulator